MTLNLTDKEVDFICAVIGQMQFGVVLQNQMTHLLRKIQLQANEDQILDAQDLE